MKKLIILLFLILFISGCSKNQQELSKPNYIGLPQSFTINFYSYVSSGGGDRFYDASLSFVDDKIISGSSHYTFGGIDGQKKDITCYINIEKSLWFEEGTNNVCYPNYYLNLPYIKNELQNVINSDIYKNLPKEQCPIFSVCYQVS